MNAVDARSAIDDYDPPWSSFHEFFLSRSDDDTVYLIERAGSGRRTWTVAQWRTAVLDQAARLAAAGVEVGDHAAVLGSNDADTLALTFACWIHGVRALPLSAAEGVPSLVQTLQRSDAQYLVVARAGLEQLAADVSAKTRATLVATSFSSTSSDVPSSVGPAPDLDSPILCLQSSGTSGLSKGVVLTARNLLVNADAMARAFEWTAEDRILTVLPISHGNGLLIGSFMPWYAGSSVVLTDKFSTATFWATARAESATTASVVPTILEFLLSEHDSSDMPPAMFRDVVSGSGPLRTDTARRFSDTFAPVRQLYGLSETTAVLTISPRGAVAPTFDAIYPHSPSVGTLVEHADIDVVDARGQSLSAGERGEIVSRGAMIMREYEGATELTDDALRDGWFRTGDEGAVVEDEAGTRWLLVTGRLKETIIRGGLSISPLEVDDVVLSHPSVREAVAFGYPDAAYGEDVAVFVVAAAPVDADEILGYCATYLDKARRPKRVVFGDSIPRTSTGKPRRLLLAAQYAESEPS